MAARQPPLTAYRALVFAATVFAVASWIFLVDTNLFSQSEKFQESDYIMTFYVAGHLAANGRSTELYPEPDARSFIDSSFDKAAHALLPRLPKAITAAYMYIPLVAGFFAPFSFVGPNLSLFLWQTLSILALAVCCVLLSRITAAKTSEIFFLTFLFAPVFLTLWAGQLGLAFGLLPLCVGFYLLLKEQPIPAGVVWSLLLLKPQYFFAAAFVALVAALAGRFKAVLAMSLGVISLLVLTVALFSPAVAWQWLLSHKVSDAYFFAGLQGIPSHLITGLPANLLVLLPVDARSAAKLPLYGCAAFAWLLGLWCCTNLRKVTIGTSAQISVAFIIGLILSALTMPHLLYYDLCVLLPAGALLLARKGPLPTDNVLRTIGAIGWIVVSLFLPLLLAYANYKTLPLLLETILLALFLILLWRLYRKFHAAAVLAAA